MGWIAILIYAVLWRSSFPAMPAFDEDTWGFLNPALQGLLGNGFQHTENRSFLYPGLIYWLLVIFRDFRAITILQELLAFGTGLLLLASWTEARHFVHPSRRVLPFYHLAGLGMFALYLRSPYPVYLEHFIRADNLCPFFALLTIYLLLRYLRLRFAGNSSSLIPVYGGAALLTAFLLPSFKPSFLLTAILCTAPVWIALFDRGLRPWSRLAMAGVPLLLVFVGLVLPERYFARNDPMSASFLPESVFSIHATQIRTQMAEDIAHGEAPPGYSVPQLQTILQDLDAALLTAAGRCPRNFAAIGFDADYLLYDDAFFTNLARWGGSTDAALHFCSYYYQRTWKEHPGAMLRKIGTELAVFYNLNCPAYGGGRFEFGDSYIHSRQILVYHPDQRRVLESIPSARHYFEVQHIEGEKSHVISISWLGKRVDRWLAASYTPILVLFICASLWALWDPARRARFGGIVAITAIAYGFSFGNNLGISILHSLEVVRYTRIQFPTVLLSQSLSIAFLITAFIWQISGWRKRSSEVGKESDFFELDEAVQQQHSAV